MTNPYANAIQRAGPIGDPLPALLSELGADPALVFDGTGLDCSTYIRVCKFRSQPSCWYWIVRLRAPGASISGSCWDHAIRVRCMAFWAASCGPLRL